MVTNGLLYTLFVVLVIVFSTIDTSSDSTDSRTCGGREPNSQSNSTEDAKRIVAIVYHTFIIAVSLGYATAMLIPVYE